MDDHRDEKVQTAEAVRNCLRYLLSDVSDAGLRESALHIADAIKALEKEVPEVFIAAGAEHLTSNRPH